MAIEPHDIIAAARGWIGTPYRHQASLKGIGCDCIGLVHGVARELGLDVAPLPAYSADWAEGTGREPMLDGFAAAMQPHPLSDAWPQGAVGVFRMLRAGPAKHCGFLAETTVIHSRANKRVSEEALTPELRRRLAAVFVLGAE